MKANHIPHTRDQASCPEHPKLASFLSPRTPSAILILVLSLPAVVAGLLSKARGLPCVNCSSIVSVAGILLAFFGLWIVRRPASRYVLFGIGTPGTLTALFSVFVVLSSALMTMAFSIRGLLAPLPPALPRFALAIALVGVWTNIVTGLRQSQRGSGSGDPALMAGGQQALTDAGLALGILAGIAAAPLGYPRVDMLSGILLGGVLTRSIFSRIRTIFSCLTREISPGILGKIREVSLSTPGAGREIHADIAMADTTNH